jgi:hypothetical protein
MRPDIERDFRDEPAAQPVKAIAGRWVGEKWITVTAMATRPYANKARSQFQEAANCLTAKVILEKPPSRF